MGRAWLLVLLSVLSGCVTYRNFRDPHERPTRRTAYTLARGDTEISTGLVGLDLNNVGATLGVAHGFGGFSQVSVNGAHAMMGILSAGAKFTITDTRWYGLGVSGNFLYARPKALWILPKSVREPIDRLDMVIAPMRVIQSFPLTNWFAFHLATGYTHSAIFGPVEVGDTLVQGGIGSRQAFFEPVAVFYLGSRVALFGGAHLPAYAQVFERVEAETELQPGVVAGVRSSEWRRIPNEKLIRMHGGIELWFGRLTHTYLRLFAVRGILARAGIGPPALPAALVFWRF